MARLRAALRRDDLPAQPATVFSIGTAWSDLRRRRTVTRETGGGESGDARPVRSPVHLTRTEWRMLDVLLRSPGQLVPARRLLTELWGPGAEHTRTTCGSTWPGCAASWKTTRRGRATC